MVNVIQTKRNNNQQKIKLAQVAITYNCNKDCSYCFIENQRGYSNDMSIKDYTSLLDWFKRNNIPSFNLTGGEPTIHPHIKKFLEIADEKGFRPTIFSNGLFPEKHMDYFSKVKSFLINYNPESHYTREEYKLLHKNLSNISKKKIPIVLQFNITEKINSCKHIIEAYHKYNVQKINLDFIKPNSLKSNCFIDKKIFVNKKRLLLSFIEELEKEGIKLRVSRPMPKCLFTKKEIFKLKKKGIIYFNCGVGYSILTVNPNLSSYPCLSLFYNGPKITSFSNIEEYRKFYNKSINTLKWKRSLYDTCKSCIYHLRKDCQGACLCHKTGEFHIKTSEDFIIYSQYPTNELTDLIKPIETSINELNNIFGKINKKLRIYLFNNKEDLLFYSGAYHFPSWVGGFAAQNLIYYQKGSKTHKRITHELCHLYLQHFSKSKLPTWLSEGFCEYVNFGDNQKEFIKLMETKDLIPFKKLYDCGKMSLLKYDQSPLDKNICYHQSHNIVRYLINKFGLEKVMNLINSEYDNFDKYFRKIIGKEFSEIEKEWQAIFKNVK